MITSKHLRNVYHGQLNTQDERILANRGSQYIVMPPIHHRIWQVHILTIYTLVQFRLDAFCAC